MEGMRDPFCRAAYTQREADTREYYSRLANTRRSSSALSRGDVAFAAPDEDCVCILRYDAGETYLCCVNRGWKSKRLHLSPGMFSGAEREAIAAAFEGCEVQMDGCSAEFIKLK